MPAFLRRASFTRAQISSGSKAKFRTTSEASQQLANGYGRPAESLLLEPDSVLSGNWTTSALALLPAGRHPPLLKPAHGLSDVLMSTIYKPFRAKRAGKRLHVRKLLLELLRRGPRLHAAACKSPRQNQSSREMPPSALASKVTHNLVDAQRAHGRCVGWDCFS